MWAGLQAFPPAEACPPAVTAELARLSGADGPAEGARGHTGAAGTVDDTVVCPVCREPLRQETDRTWPGGCGHRLHQRCYAQMRGERAGTHFCPECQVGVDGLPRPCSCPHGVRHGLCTSGCGRRCVHNRWSGTTPCPTCHPGTGRAAAGGGGGRKPTATTTTHPSPKERRPTGAARAEGPRRAATTDTNGCRHRPAKAGSGAAIGYTGNVWSRHGHRPRGAAVVITALPRVPSPWE